MTLSDKTHWSHTVCEPPLGKDEVEVFSGLLGQFHLMVSTDEVHLEKSLASRIHIIPDIWMLAPTNTSRRVGRC